MTFEDDFVRITDNDGIAVNVTCVSIGIQWPPPATLVFQGLVFRRVSYSSIPDEAREKMTHVCRGAEYSLDPDAEILPASPRMH